MRRVLNYFRCTTKKSAKYLPYTIFFTFAVAVVLYFLLGALTAFETAEEPIPKKIGIGLVGDTDDKYLKIGIGAVKTIDATKNYLDIIVYDDENKALSDMKESEITGYLSVPEGFISNVLDGVNTPAVFYAKNSPVDLAPMLINDVLATVSNLVVESQVGIFALEDYYVDNGIKGRGKAVKEINNKYISIVLDRDGMVKVQEIEGVEENKEPLSLYYFCAFLIVCLFFVGILSVNSVLKKDLSLSKLLYSTGTGNLSQVLCDYASFLLIYLITTFAIALLGMLLLGLDVLGVFGFVIKLLPVILLISSMQFFIYELCSNVISACLLQFFGTMIMCYISGLFYPDSFFTETLRKIAAALPVGTVFSYLKQTVAGVATGDYIGAVLGYTVVFLLLSLIIRCIKIRREGV